MVDCSLDERALFLSIQRDALLDSGSRGRRTGFGGDAAESDRVAMLLHLGTKVLLAARASQSIRRVSCGDQGRSRGKQGRNNMKALRHTSSMQRYSIATSYAHNLIAHRVRCSLSLTLQAEEDLLHPAQISRPLGRSLAPAILQLDHLCDSLPGRTSTQSIVACLNKSSFILLVLRNLLLLLLVVVGIEVIYRLLGFADNLLLACCRGLVASLDLLLLLLAPGTARRP